MNINPDFITVFCMIGLGAIALTCRNRNLAERLSRGTIFRRMSTTSCSWIGSALIATAIAVVLASTSIQDTPGPMEASKPEFTLELTAPLCIVSALAALTGTLSLASSFRGKT
jgi:hypothetical protein